MAAKEFPAGTQLVQSEQPLNAIHVIARGTVKATYPGGEFYLQKGDVIGVCELFYDMHFISYQVEENAVIASYACSAQQLHHITHNNADMTDLIILSLFHQFHEILDQYELLQFDCSNLYNYLVSSYEDYRSFCARHNFAARALPDLDNLSELVLEEDVESWLSGFYRHLRDMVSQTPVKDQDPDFLLGLILKASQDIHHVISVCGVMYDYKSEIASLLMNENHLDFFDLYASVLYKTGSNAEDSTSLIAALSTMMIQLESLPSIDKDMYRERVAEYKDRLNSLSEYQQAQSDEQSLSDSTPEIVDSLNTILSYSGVDEETASSFRTAISKFSNLSDKNATDDACRKLRLTITKMYYTIYEAAFMRSLRDPNVPKVVKMFFNFGYMDEHLAGMENAAYLYSIVDRLPTNPAKKVYSMYEWLLAIYNGQKVPSRNEFDTDYQAHIHELKVTGKITAAQETALANDHEKQVQFEIQNMFPPVNKISFGRISSFCPVFSEHNILKDLSASIVSADRVTEAFSKLRALDFSAYYRDTIYTNSELGIGREAISVEILPDIILMPNIGIRGVMWQEIEGRKRTTPARMMVSIFEMEDLNHLLIRLTGEYRWEMCRRIQGARWNDITDASLTSEYFEYIQFYRKNRDLSAEAKDKIKLNMQKAKNSFKEMFIRDYESWITFEGAGSPRLNKVARGILFTYCPFAKECRESLKINPLYKELVAHYEARQKQWLHHYDNLFQKLKNMNAEIPEVLEKQRHYLEK